MMRLKRCLKEASEILETAVNNGSDSLTDYDVDKLRCLITEAADCAGVIDAGHKAIQEVLNRCSS